MEEDDTIIAEPELTGDDKADSAALAAHKARCPEKNMAYMNLYTMKVEKGVTWGDVKLAASKASVWFVNAAEEAEHVVFCLRMGAFKICAKQWVDWCKEHKLKSEELGLPVIVN